MTVAKSERKILEESLFDEWKHVILRLLNGSDVRLPKKENKSPWKI